VPELADALDSKSTIMLRNNASVAVFQRRSESR